jgi:hypothetical protein
MNISIRRNIEIVDLFSESEKISDVVAIWFDENQNRKGHLFSEFKRHLKKLLARSF